MARPKRAAAVEWRFEIAACDRARQWPREPAITATYWRRPPPAGSPVDESGRRRLTWGYDSAQRPNSGASGNVSSVTDPLGKVTTYQNDNAHGQAGTIQRPDGTLITRGFDARFRLSSRTVAGVTTQYAYDAAGRLAKVTAADGSWRSYGYDNGGFVSSVTNDRGESTTITRDATGAAIKTSTYTASGSLSRQSARTLNAVGHLASVVDSRNYTTRYLYGNDGRFSGTTDPVGNTRSQQLDVLSRPTAVTLPNTTAMRQAGGPATVLVQHSYDTLNNHTAVVDTNTVATGYAYDPVNRRNAEAGNDNGSIGLVLNAAGDVTSYTDARGTTLTPSYDAIGRLAAVAYGSVTDRTYSYVSGRTDGLLSATTDGLGSSAWTYDSAGRMLTQQQTVYSQQQTLRVSRDSIGRPTSITYPSGMVVGVNYSADVVTSINVNSTALLSNVTYLPQSQVATGWRWGNGTSYGRSFDADGRVTSVTLGSTQRSYGFDAAGRITSQTDTGAAGTRQSTYAYDEAGQLISYVPPSGTGQTFTCDPSGNRRSQTVNGYSGSYAYASHSNRLSSSPVGSFQ